MCSGPASLHSAIACPPVWASQVEIGQRPGHDDEGEELDNSLAPPPISKWSEEEEQLLFYKIQASGDTMDLDDLREFINNMCDLARDGTHRLQTMKGRPQPPYRHRRYVDPNSPISTDVEPGHSAEEYLEALLSTPGAPKSARFLEDCFLDDQQLLQFDAFTATQACLHPHAHMHAHAYAHESAALFTLCGTWAPAVAIYYDRGPLKVLYLA